MCVYTYVHTYAYTQLPVRYRAEEYCTYIHTYIYSNTYTEKVPGVFVEDGVEQAVVQVAVLLRPVVVKVDKVLQVVVRSEVVHMLLLPQDSHTHYLTQTGGHQGMEGCGTLGRGCGSHMKESKVNYMRTYIQVRQNNLRLPSSLLCFHLPLPSPLPLPLSEGLVVQRSNT